MIFIIQNGRFGNQLFQINYVYNLKKKNERVFFIGFNETKEFFLNDKNFFFINCKFLILRRFKIISYLRKAKLFSLIEENINGSRIYNHFGLIRNIKFIDGFFQSENYLNKFFLKTLIDSRKFKLEDDKAKKKIKYNKKINVFIHIRLTDFAIWPNKKNSAIMSFNWYKNLYLKYFNKKKCFIFSDNFKKLRKNNFFNLKNFKLVNQNYINSFFLMKNCKYGIISCSSFSWWAAYLSNKKYKNTKFFAPNYWAGYKAKKFYPNRIKSSFLIYK